MNEQNAPDFDHTKIEVDLFRSELDGYSHHDIQKNQGLYLSVNYRDHGGVGWPVLRLEQADLLREYLEAYELLKWDQDVELPNDLEIRVFAKDIPKLIELLQAAYIADQIKNRELKENADN